jgi:hypothetical protein
MDHIAHFVGDEGCGAEWFCAAVSGLAAAAEFCVGLSAGILRDDARCGALLMEMGANGGLKMLAQEFVHRSAIPGRIGCPRVNHHTYPAKDSVEGEEFLFSGEASDELTGAGDFCRIGKSEQDGRLAQLVRAPALQAGGRRFEPCTAHHSV